MRLHYRQLRLFFRFRRYWVIGYDDHVRISEHRLVMHQSRGPIEIVSKETNTDLKVYGY